MTREEIESIVVLLSELPEDQRKDLIDSFIEKNETTRIDNEKSN